MAGVKRYVSPPPTRFGSSRPPSAQAKSIVGRHCVPASPLPPPTKFGPSRAGQGAVQAAGAGRAPPPTAYPAQAPIQATQMRRSGVPMSGQAKSLPQASAPRPLAPPSGFAGTVQRMKKNDDEAPKPNTKSKAEQWQARRRATRMGGGVTYGGSGVNNQDTFNDNLARVSLLDKVMKSEAVSKRQRKLEAYITTGPGGEGETDIGEGGKPHIKIGRDALVSEDEALTVLLHELDHAKLIYLNRPIRLGGYEVTNILDQRTHRRKKGTYEYELEELVVRLRDYQRILRGKIQYSKELAVERIIRQRKILDGAIEQLKGDEFIEFDVSDTVSILNSIMSEFELL